MTIVGARWLVGSALSAPLENGAVRISGSMVTGTGTISELRRDHPDDDVVDAPDAILLPGFVNSHVHLYGTLAHGIPTDAAPSGFLPFLEDYWWPKVENVLDQDMITAATDWVCAEMLRTGTTAFFDILEAPNSLPDALLVEKDIVEHRGIRGVLSFEATERIDTNNGQLGLDENIRLIEDCRSSELVSGLMSIHTTFTCSREFIGRAFQLATDLDVLFHAHVNEGVHEGQWCESNIGKRTLEYYEELGVAGPRFLASQCVRLSEREQDIIIDHGVRVSHMPLSNCEVGGGIAPIPELADRGATIGLGSDGYVNDMFEVMRVASLIHKARLQDPGAMPARDALHMATEGSAEALGLEGVGRLEPGYSADLQLVDASFPTPITRDNLVEQLVMWRNGSHVKDVMVAGVWRVRNGEVLGADLDLMRAKTREQAARLWTGP